MNVKLFENVVILQHNVGFCNPRDSSRQSFYLRKNGNVELHKHLSHTQARNCFSLRLLQCVEESARILYEKHEVYDDDMTMKPFHNLEITSIVSKLSVGIFYGG
jgi:hypothetical protein